MILKKQTFPFNNRDFVSLWLGQGISQLGDSVFNIAMTWLILSRPESATVLAGFMFFIHATYLPVFAMAGPFIDRYDKRRIMFFSDLTRGGLVLILAIYSFNQSLANWAIYLIACIDGMLTAVFTSAKVAMLPDIVDKEDIARANSLNVTIANICDMAGPVVGGLLIALPAVGFSGASMINALTFFVGALGLSLIRNSRKRVATGKIHESLWVSFVSGFRYVVSERRLIRILLYFSALSVTGACIFVLMAIFAAEALHVGAAGLGMLTSTFFAGGLTGALLTGIMDRKFRSGYLLVCLFMGEGMAYVFLSTANTLSVAAAVYFIYGVVSAASAIMIRSYLQSVVQEEYRGRFFSFMYLMTDGLTPVAMGISGIAAGRFGAPTVILSCGMLFTFVAFSGFFIKDIIEIRK